MNARKWAFLLVPVVLLLSTLACGFNVSTAAIKEAKLARDNESVQPTSSFSPADTFYCNVEVENAPDDTTLKAVWTAVDVPGQPANTPLDQTELKTGSGTVHFKLTNTNPWPAGKYKVDLYMNDKLNRSIEFQVAE
jgi:hypothetical protein